MQFNLKSKFLPAGDQPQAIEKLSQGLMDNVPHQTLLGVTGSGKTFTMANVISRIQKPTLVISHNKTLAAQLYEEFKEFFPDNAVHYFVSYYDYYQPEAYLPQTDTYIEKDAKINATIDALRHASTAGILTRKDVIIVASVSCIYGVGNPDEYYNVSLELRIGGTLARKDFLKHLVRLQYTRNSFDPRQGHFRVRENTIEIYLPSGEEAIDVELDKKNIASLHRRRTATGYESSIPLDTIRIFPAKHFVAPEDKLELAMANIQQELSQRLKTLDKTLKILEAARLKQRTEFDLAMLRSTGYVNGIENYSRQLDFREPGSPPHTLLDYFRYAYSENFLTFIDESHATIPQIRGVEAGDRARKQVLIDYGFRLPSALDNRPLNFPEFNKKINQTLYVSATPSAYELQKSGSFIAEQIIRPTGILDPRVEVRPIAVQMRDVIQQVKQRSQKGERSLVMAITKRLAEDIAEYLKDAGINATYLHADIKTLDRPEVLRQLRIGTWDALVGINLLREGIDLPEVSFIAILDADKEGFLRNETTLLQIIGRAARHSDGQVILYGDRITASMKVAIHETRRRRRLQEKYNHVHGITPQSVQKEIRSSSLLPDSDHNQPDDVNLPKTTPKELIVSLEREMKKASRELNFELAARLRDRLNQLRQSI